MDDIIRKGGPVTYRLLTVAALLAAVAGLYWWLDLGQWLNLTTIQHRLGDAQRVAQDHPWLTGIGFVVGYAALTGLAVPGAAVLTLAAGAVFGLAQGVALVSIASTAGATLAMLLARYVFRDWVERRMPRQLASINQGLATDGWVYLLTLRLIPIFPFFAVNALLGLTRMRVLPYAAISWLGMLPGTIVYVNAGQQLATIRSTSDVLTWPVIASLVALAGFGWVTKMVVAQVRRARMYRQWRRPRSYDVNLAVIGAGAGGLVTSYIAATVNAKVALIERSAMGGDCLNYGCVPSKALIRTGKAAHDMRHANTFGLADATPTVTWPDVMARIDQIIADIAPHDSAERYRGLGVDVIAGQATIVDPWTIDIAGPATPGTDEATTRRIRARNIVLATGAAPTIPAIPGLASVTYLTTDTLWQALRDRETMPRSLVILGGGPVGCELGQTFARLGADVTIIDTGPTVLHREEPHAQAAIRQALAADGVRVLTEHHVESVADTDGQVAVHITGPTQSTVITAEELLIAVGRTPRLVGLGLENLGYDTEKPLAVNEYLQTRLPNICAVGDVAGPYQLTHAAAHQAWYASVNALFGQFKRFAVDYRVMPVVTFTSPKIARVGLTTAEADAQGIAVDTTSYDLADLDRAITDSAATGTIHVLTQQGRDTIVGATIVAETADHLLTDFTLAMKHGIGLRKLLATTQPYPTWAEGNKYVAGQWRAARKPEKLLALVAKYHHWRLGR